MIFAMVVLGGVTRLTESGLSITEWRPIAGALPPFGDADWRRLFDLYRETPEYRTIHAGMTLADFKTIFWWEYAHRLWGRLIAVAFAAPFAYFLWRGRIRPWLRPHLLAILALGASQGGLGWFMVASGLTDRPEVSQYRLVAHLALALAIYAYILWAALRLLRPVRAGIDGPAGKRLRRRLSLVAVLAGATLLAGGFTAGLDAGYIHNTFPLMGGRVVPEDLLVLSPPWINPFENPVAAQFAHRWLAVALVASCLWLWAGGSRAALAPMARGAVTALAIMALVQGGLGIATLLLVVPVPLAAAHQAGAVAFVGLLLWTWHETRAA